MKNKHYLLYILLIVLSCCNTQEAQEANRQKLIEGLDDHRVKRVTEEQVMAAAFSEGKRFVGILLENEAGEKEYFADSLSKATSHGAFSYVKTGAALPSESRELALWEAYEYSIEQSQPVKDNVQNLSDDQLLYTYPVTIDGQLQGMWALKLSRKTLIRGL